MASVPRSAGCFNTVTERATFSSLPDTAAASSGPEDGHRGQLTTGVAHDLNNALTIIIGANAILADGVADRSDLVAIVDMIEEAGKRGADLIRRLLAFARKQPLRPRAVDVNSLVREAAKLLRSTLGEHIEIHMKLANDVSCALINPSQLTARSSISDSTPATRCRRRSTLLSIPAMSCSTAMIRTSRWLSEASSLYEAM